MGRAWRGRTAAGGSVALGRAGASRGIVKQTYATFEGPKRHDLDAILPGKDYQTIFTFPGIVLIVLVVLVVCCVFTGYPASYGDSTVKRQRPPPSLTV